jgi:hypothetical protein
MPALKEASYPIADTPFPQSESESRDLKRQLGITKTQYNSRMLDDRTAQLETALGRQKSLERQLAEEQASSKRQAAEVLYCPHPDFSLRSGRHVQQFLGSDATVVCGKKRHWGCN